jgi:hypothetical protein
LPFAGLPAFIAGCIDAPNRVVAPISSWVHSRMLTWASVLVLELRDSVCDTAPQGAPEVTNRSSSLGVRPAPGT